VGAAGANGTARAYGAITGAGAIQAARTKNIVAVSRPAGLPTGVFCIQAAPGISSADTPAQVSVNWGDSGTSTPAAHSHPGFNCPAGQFEVITRDTAANNYSNSVAFYILIP
jgi:hypothetical protein